MKAGFAAIGLGNPHMRDDAVGVSVVNALARRAAEFPGVDFLDCGACGFGLFHALDGREGAAIVDCARMGLEPGAMRVFSPEEFKSAATAAGGTHGCALDVVLETAARLGRSPARTVLIGIEPLSTGPGEALSQPLSARFGEYVRALASELKRMMSGAPASCAIENHE